MARQYLDLARIYGAVDQARANEQSIKNNELQNQRYQRQMQLEDAELARQEGIRGIYKGAIEIGEDGSPRLNEKKLITDLYGIAPEKALETQDSFTKRDSDAAKAKRENQKFELENKSATVKYLKDKLATVRDDAGFQAFKQEAMELGAQDLVSSAPLQYDPQWQQSQMVNADKFLERNTPKYERVDLGGKIQVVDVNPVTNPKFAEMKLDKVATISEKESMRHNRVSEANSAATLAETKRKNSLEGGEGGQGKAPSGYRWAADGQSLEPIPGGPGTKLSDSAIKQQAGVDNVKKAISDYRTALSGWSRADFANPSKRAEMGTYYNNMMLQAKEAYQLGVLNGPDLAILTDVVGDPNSIKGVVYGKEALDKQAEVLDKLMSNVGNTTATSNQNSRKQIIPKGADAGTVQTGNPAKPIMSKAEAKMPASVIAVTAPNGKTYTFKSQAAANQFKRQAGIK
jgi:hypothetical protein